MKVLGSGLVFLFCCLGAGIKAATVEIQSPDSGQTFAYAEAINHTLRWDDKNKVLEAFITFSNHDYAGHGEPLAEKTFVFHFPGIIPGKEVKNFFAQNPNGDLVLVAQKKQFLFFQSIQPAEGCVIHIHNKKGNITVSLTADDSGSARENWDR